MSRGNQFVVPGRLWFHAAGAKARKGEGAPLCAYMGAGNKHEECACSSLCRHVGKTTVAPYDSQPRTERFFDSDIGERRELHAERQRAGAWSRATAISDGNHGRASCRSRRRSGDLRVVGDFAFRFTPTAMARPVSATYPIPDLLHAFES